MSRGERAAYTLLFGLAVASVVAFLWWWLDPHHLPHNAHGHAHWVDAVIFALLTLVFAHRLFMDGFAWIAAWGMRRPHPPLPPQDGLRVAFITTFVPSSESVDLLRTTLPAMLLADYPHDVWLLDEGDDPEAKALCEELGVHYFSRKGVAHWNQVDGPFAAKTKGGNHNAWYDAHGHSYDVVAQIDTDFLPRRDFLTATLGFFRDPRVGWVGTPQVYGNHESFVARAAAQQLYTFYGPVLRGFGSRDMCALIGANHVIRVEALRGIGWYAGHLTEDLLTGLRLHARGWRSRYAQQPLAVGEGPSTWQAYFQQQDRWAFGCMDILRRHTPKLLGRMRPGQAALYLSLQQFYFTGLASLVGLGLLAAYFLGGIYPADVPVVPMLCWIAPLFVMRLVMSLFLQRFSPRGTSERGLLLRGRYAGAVVWPVYLQSLIGVARGKRLTFKVTPKGGVDEPTTTPLGVVRPHLVIAGFTLALTIVGLATGRTAVTLMFWAVVNTVVLGTFAVGALLTGRGLKQRIPLVRRLHLPASRRAPALLVPAGELLPDVWWTASAPPESEVRVIPAPAPADEVAADDARTVIDLDRRTVERRPVVDLRPVLDLREPLPFFDPPADDELEEATA